jgi:hypothetical protein
MSDQVKQAPFELGAADKGFTHLDGLLAVQYRCCHNHILFFEKIRQLVYIVSKPQDHGL